MAKKDKKKQAPRSEEKVLMRMPDGTEVLVPRKKVRIKKTWGWDTVEVVKEKADRKG